MKWILPVKDMDVGVKCFSHVASHPKEVKEWVPVNLKELGDTIMFDKETVLLMVGNDITFLQGKKGAKVLRGIMINKSDESEKK